MEVARVGEEPVLLAGQRYAQQRPAPALEDRALQLEQQRGGESAGAHEHLLALVDLEAVAREQVGEAGRVGNHGVGSSGKFSARWTRRASRTAARSAGVAIRKRASSSR